MDQGASAANAVRAHAAVTVLARLGYVDVRRVAAHGHSMGAFVTAAFVAAYPGDVRVASHTAGGVLFLGLIPLEGVPAAASSAAPTRATSIAACATPRSPRMPRY